MRSASAWGLAIGLAALLVVDALAVRAGVAPGVVPTLAGPSLWITSRAAGVTAYLALTLDVVFGLLVSTGAADRVVPRARSVDAHRWLSAAALALTAVHALALLGDRFVRFDVVAVLVPFASPYRTAAVGLGVVAAYGALVLHASFGWRKRVGARTWRAIHHGSFAVFAAALAHGLLAGSDTGTAGMRALYLASLAAVAGLTGYRLLLATRRRPLTRSAGRAS